MMCNCDFDKETIEAYITVLYLSYRHDNRYCISYTLVLICFHRNFFFLASHCCFISDDRLASTPYLISQCCHSPIDIITGTVYGITHTQRISNPVDHTQFMILSESIIQDGGDGVLHRFI